MDNVCRDEVVGVVRVDFSVDFRRTMNMQRFVENKHKQLPTRVSLRHCKHFHASPPQESLPLDMVNALSK